MNYERNIIMTLHRDNKIVWVRRYARIDTAIRRCTQLAVLEGQPKDVMEMAHNISGRQLGTIKLHTGNKLTAQWLWD
jgi:metal-responsive CopG/Arc/MetJ family transcriptional regulator